ncbi:MAG: bifunctional diaminohydroxyphosphoribosylaminopyrimidine deaminase/5-amino-6-(5-phosphoribosylamino)uracil reductase RibD [Candidatus Eremiobacteraeota bacterium]|nr:bifunctional diaminohydroxyphosphoribosylaminopyrimidine deaminase/5-amino-6-(5-phosphoribosylamino)uracil reductase RibD [Candidatus Eremiobacteraeota bacterium]
MDTLARPLTPLDRLFLARAYELARRGIGNTAPNPPVGALVVAGGRVAGEGYHQRAGDAHAERSALDAAGSSARGGTLYVSLEPCGHVGRTPPCVDAVIAAGIARVVAGAHDPAGHGGAGSLRKNNVEVIVADDAAAHELIEPFAIAANAQRPYLGLKMAMSLDGSVARRPDVHEPLSSQRERQLVRELRASYDAVLVGAGTIRIDDPELTVRPARRRSRPYHRIVAVQSETLPPDRRVFAGEPGYATTIVLAPAGAREAHRGLERVADVLYVGAQGDPTLNLNAAMRALRAREICSVLCEGGPRLAASLIASGLVDRFYWAIAPRLLANDAAVPVLSGRDLAALEPTLRFDRVERIGEDVMLSGAVRV